VVIRAGYPTSLPIDVTRRTVDAFFDGYVARGGFPMKSIVKCVVALMFCMLAAAPSFGKLKVVLAIDVEDTSTKQRVASAIAARLNSTDRYSVVDSILGADFMFAVICLKTKTHNNQVIGLVCAGNAEYYPFGTTVGYWMPGAGAMIIDDDEKLRSITDGLLDAFINDSTDSKLAEYKARLTKFVSDTCNLYPSVCRTP
jgi:hypothetical protein